MRPSLSLLRLLGFVWRPLRKLTEEVRQARIALEVIAYELKALRAHLDPDAPLAEEEDSGVEVGYTTPAEQVNLERIAIALQSATGAPSSEDEILIEYARLMEVGQIPGIQGTFGQETREKLAREADLGPSAAPPPPNSRYA